MFDADHETVFILGAGASWHYNYPTGEELVDLIVKKALDTAKYLTEERLYLYNKWPDFFNTYDKNPPSDSYAKKPYWGQFIKECNELVQSLKYVKPLVIDNFLSCNEGLAPIGKLFIAWVLLDCEAAYYPNRENINRRTQILNSSYMEDRKKTIDLSKCKDNWVRFIIHRLAQKPKFLLQNKVTFITFNYDISLERAIFDGLKHIEAFEKNEINEFIQSDNFLHIYGQIHKNFSEKERYLNVLKTCKDYEDYADRKTQQAFSFIDNMHQAYKSSQTIHTIEDCHETQGEKYNCAKIIEQSIKALETAKYVYILGYGFDERNSERLKLGELLKDPSLQENKLEKRVYFTNFGDRNLINKKASNLFLGVLDRFLPPIYIQSTGSKPYTRQNYYEKSIKDVYQALEQDFDFL